MLITDMGVQITAVQTGGRMTVVGLGMLLVAMQLSRWKRVVTDAVHQIIRTEWVHHCVVHSSPWVRPLLPPHVSITRGLDRPQHDGTSEHGIRFCYSIPHVVHGSVSGWAQVGGAALDLCAEVLQHLDGLAKQARRSPFMFGVDDGLVDRTKQAIVCAVSETLVKVFIQFP